MPEFDNDSRSSERSYQFLGLLRRAGEAEEQRVGRSVRVHRDRPVPRATRPEEPSFKFEHWFLGPRMELLGFDKVGVCFRLRSSANRHPLMTSSLR